MDFSGTFGTPTYMASILFAFMLSIIFLIHLYISDLLADMTITGC
jgi:uncharacterized membrane protein YtjA (UPF0391 family)